MPASIDTSPQEAQGGESFADGDHDSGATPEPLRGSEELINLSNEDDAPSFPPRPESETSSTLAATQQIPHADQQEVRESPQVATLRAMFPDFDGAVLQSVLESVNYDQDRAVDILLGMSDPEYVSAEHAAASQADLALDEQLARQLALEDQQQPPSRATGQSWPRRERGDMPYQPRQHAPSHNGQPQTSPSGERGEIQEFQETLGRIAESGKRTFSSIVSKAKAKINEYNQQRTSQSSTSSTVPQWGSAPPAQLDRHTTQQLYAQDYYDYDSDYVDVSRVSQTLPDVAEKAQTTEAQPGGYDVGSYSTSSSKPVSMPLPTTPPPAASLPSLPPVSLSAQSASPAAAVTRSPLSSPRPSGEVPRPPPTLSGSPINAAKLGLLPKRPVSLLSPQTPARGPSNDELEYVENPFEEGRD
ncbi:hypothetical protein AcV5_006826 [Taiwanofungus camphoratus]|nr:hypothetical protein AcV5_006826 [Antrodia cinnamomea]